MPPGPKISSRITRISGVTPVRMVGVTKIAAVEGRVGHRGAAHQRGGAVVQAGADQ